MNRPASIVFLVLGVLLGLLGIGSGVSVWVAGGEVRPAMVALAEEARAMDPDVDTLYHHGVVLLNAARRTIRDLPPLVAQTGKVLHEAERLAKDAETLVRRLAAAMRGLGKSLARLLDPTLDLDDLAKRLEATAGELVRLLPEVATLQGRLETAVSNATPMATSLEAVGNTLPAPADRPFAAVDTFRREGRLLEVFDQARVALSGLLVALGLVSFIAAFGHLRGARRWA